MKRLLVVLVSVFCLCGCSSKQTMSFTTDDFTLSETNITTKGIMCGSTAEEFKTAYSNCDVSVGVMYNDDSSIQETNINKIIYTNDCRVYLSAICIDDNYMSTKQFMKEHKIDNGLDNWFSNNQDYLKEHTAIYKCLIFTFSNGEVSNIEVYDKDYNEEK